MPKNKNKNNGNRTAKKKPVKKEKPDSKTKKEKNRRPRNTRRDYRQDLNQDENEKMFFDSLERASTEEYPFAALNKRGLDFADDEINILNSLFYSTPQPSPKPESSFNGIIDIPTPEPLTAPRHLPPISPIYFDDYDPYADMNYDLLNSEGRNSEGKKSKGGKSKGGKRRITKKRKSRKIKKLRK
jgi:hypothetical protein